jgi:phosphatidylserine/phosphatidylglycerophosphate/cardiolipin synthase-like enzyme
MGDNDKPKPPPELENRPATVQANTVNTLEVPCDPHDGNWQRWFNTDPEMQPVRHGNKVVGLIDGPETFVDMVSAIKTASSKEHYIYMLNWFVDLNFDLITSTKLIDLLTDADKRGVQIRGMFWDQAGTQNTAEVKQVNGLTNGAAILDNNTLNFGSHHQKVLIVKGEQGLITYCGGIDFNPDRNSQVGKQPGSPMHDVHCRIEGPAAFDLLNIFLQRWTDHPDSAKLDKAKGGLIGARELVPAAVGDKHVQIGRTFGNGSKHAGIKNSKGQNFYSFAPHGERTAEKLIFHAIGQAQRFIYIEDQYLISMDASNKLKAQLPKIEKLIILIPHSSISDLPGVWNRRKRFIDNLLSDPATRHKVTICYRKKSGDPPNPKKVLPQIFHAYIHAKVFIIDDKFAIIGSANCNNRGYTHDSEVVAGIFDESRDSP